MKSGKFQKNRLLICLLILTFLPLVAFSNKEINVTIKKEINVDSNTTIDFNGHDGDLKVVTWNKSKAHLEINVTIDGDTKDVETFMDLMNKKEFENDRGKVVYDGKFYSMWKQKNNGPIKLKLSNGKEITLKKLKISYLLSVPDSNPLVLHSKYSKVEVPDLSGKTELDFYECSFVVGSIDNDAVVKVKYGEGSIVSTKNLDLSLYESELEMKKTGDLELDSKYSILVLNQAGDLEMSSYEDELTIQDHGNVTLKAEYSTVSLSDLGKGSFTLYEGGLTTRNVGTLELSAKYLEINLEDVGTIEALEMYESTLKCDALGKLSAESKYSTYEIGALTGSFELSSSYEDNVTLMNVSKDFTKIGADSKYTDFVIDIPENCSIDLEGDMQYAQIKMNELELEGVDIKKKSDHRTYTGTIRHGSGHSSGSLKFKMYEGGVTIK